MLAAQRKERHRCMFNSFYLKKKKKGFENKTWLLLETLPQMIVVVGEQKPLCLAFRGKTPISRAKLLPFYKRRRNVLTCWQHRAWDTRLSGEKAACVRH